MSVLKFGEDITLSSGNQVFIRKWGFREFKRNTALFKDVLTEVIEAIKGFAPADNQSDLDILALAQQRVPEMLEQGIDRVEQLLVAFLEGGEDSLDKLYGVQDVIDVLTAGLRVNGLTDLLGKLGGLRDLLGPVVTPAN